MVLASCFFSIRSFALSAKSQFLVYICILLGSFSLLFFLCQVCGKCEDGCGLLPFLFRAKGVLGSTSSLLDENCCAPPAPPVLLSHSQVMMWLDILTLPQARRFPPVPMEPPSPLKVGTVM